MQVSNQQHKEKDNKLSDANPVTVKSHSYVYHCYANKKEALHNFPECGLLHVPIEITSTLVHYHYYRPAVLNT